MRKPDSELLAMIAKLAKMPVEARSEILFLLTAAERARLDSLARPRVNVDETLSEPLATLVEGLRFGSVDGITDRARTALVQAATFVGDHGSVSILERADLRLSLFDRVKSAVGFLK